MQPGGGRLTSFVTFHRLFMDITVTDRVLPIRRELGRSGEGKLCVLLHLFLLMYFL